jgi:hypothetical protein
VSLRRDERGGTYVELCIVILPVLTIALGVLQMAELYTAKMALDHAAVNAARSASVVFADDPRFYGGEPANTEGPQRKRAVQIAAARALAPFALDGSIRSAEVSFPTGVPRQNGAALTVEVRSNYRCSVPLVHALVCRGGTLALVGKATLPSNAADFEY